MEKSSKLINKNISLRDFNFSGFSSSKNWIGYFERKKPYSFDFVDEAVDLFCKRFQKKSNYIVMTALCFDKEREKNIQIINRFNDIFLNAIERGVLNPMSSEFENYLYGDVGLPVGSINISFNFNDFIILSRLVMSHSGVIGQVCFYINYELNVAIYPHDDTGFGCIALNEDSREGIDFLNSCKINKNFNVVFNC